MEKCSQSGNSRFIDFWLNQFFSFFYSLIYFPFFFLLCLSGISRALLEVCVCEKCAEGMPPSYYDCRKERKIITTRCVSLAEYCRREISIHRVDGK